MHLLSTTSEVPRKDTMAAVARGESWTLLEHVYVIRVIRMHARMLFLHTHVIANQAPKHGTRLTLQDGAPLTWNWRQSLGCASGHQVCLRLSFSCRIASNAIWNDTSSQLTRSDNITPQNWRAAHTASECQAVTGATAALHSPAHVLPIRLTTYGLQALFRSECEAEGIPFAPDDDGNPVRLNRFQVMGGACAQFVLVLLQCMSIE